ncbi:hypothetical protein LINGRAPRIM_LOCUS2772 [Linum grandiflorum]
MRSRRTLDGWEVSQLYAEDRLAVDDERSLGNAQPHVHKEESVQPNLEFHSPCGSDADTEDDNQPLSPHSSYRGSSESDHFGRNNSDEEAEFADETQPWYNPNCDHKTLVFKKSLKFTCDKQFKDVVVEYIIVDGSDVYWVRRRQRKKEVVCRANCGWRVYANWYAHNMAFVVKPVGEDHSCTSDLEVKQLTAKWIGKKYIDRSRRSTIDLEALAAEIKNTYQLEVSPRTCYSAKVIVKRMLEGSLAELYGKLHSYILELKRSNPAGRFIVEVDLVPGAEHVLFKRFFIGFSGLRNGFLNECRRMFGIDWCFLKGEFKGMLLAAVGKDGNNQMFPICWAMVEGENTDSWNWFTEILQDQL